MKIEILSDIHISHSGFGLKPVEDVDLLIVAGDISNGFNLNLFNKFKKRCSAYKEVIYITGNHEYYECDYNWVNKNIKFCFENSNIHFLNNEFVMINGIKFIGSTCWTHIPEHLRYKIQNVMNDYDCIRYMDKLLTCNVTNMFNNIATEYLEKEINENSIVITHHAPSQMSCPDEFKGDYKNVAYCNNYENLILDKKPKFWFHGHIHDNSDYMIGDTRIICNPYGYYKRDFERKIIEI